MNPTSETQASKAREAISKTWRIAEVEDAFPRSIKPVNLGTSALRKLKAIASKADLATAQALFLAEAQKDGTPIAFTFAHAVRILESLKPDETPTSTPTAKGDAKPYSMQPVESASVPKKIATVSGPLNRSITFDR
jgi:hypothetical protein